MIVHNNYTNDDGIITIHHCLCKKDYECKHEKIRFNVILPGILCKELRICRHYFRLRLEEFSDRELMFEPKLTKAKALFSIIKDEFGCFLYEGENPEFCYMPYENLDIIKPKVIFDLRHKKYTSILDRYVVYIPFYRGYSLKYSAFDILLHVCNMVDFAEDDCLNVPIYVMNIARDYLYELLKDIENDIPPKYTQDLKRDISLVTGWLSDEPHLYLINSVKKLCIYYINFKENKNGKKRSKKHLRTNVERIGKKSK